VWYHENAIANILSLRTIRQMYRVTYDSNDETFVVHRASVGKPNMEFRMHESGLHYYDPRLHRASRQSFVPPASIRYNAPDPPGAHSDDEDFDDEAPLPSMPLPKVATEIPGVLAHPLSVVHTTQIPRVVPVAITGVPPVTLPGVVPVTITLPGVVPVALTGVDTVKFPGVDDAAEHAPEHVQDLGNAITQPVTEQPLEHHGVAANPTSHEAATTPTQTVTVPPLKSPRVPSPDARMFVITDGSESAATQVSHKAATEVGTRTPPSNPSADGDWIEVQSKRQRRGPRMTPLILNAKGTRILRDENFPIGMIANRDNGGFYTSKVNNKRFGAGGNRHAPQECVGSSCPTPYEGQSTHAGRSFPVDVIEPLLFDREVSK
jgi:hypothetical protein